MNKSILLFCFLLLAQIALPCSCWPYEFNFFNNVKKTSFNCVAVFNRMDRGYKYKNKEYGSQTGYFKLIHSFDNVHIADSIVVTGQDGLNCGEILTQFVKGDTMLLTLKDGFYESFKKDTFYLEGACGKHYLPIKNGYNNGIALNEIILKVNKIIASVQNQTLQGSIIVSPNPTKGVLKIASKDIITEVRIVDLIGKELKRSIKIDQRDFTFNVEGLNQGIYNLVIFADKKRHNSRIIIN